MNRRSAFTLIELVAALALAGLLLLVLFQVTVGLGHDRSVMQAASADPEPVQRISRRLWDDLGSSYRAGVDEGRLWVEGWSGLASGSGHHHPVRVQYRVENAENPRGGVLIREEHDLTDLSNKPRDISVIALGVAALSLEPLVGTEDPLRDNAAVSPPDPGFALRLVWHDESRSDLHLRLLGVVLEGWEE